MIRETCSCGASIEVRDDYGQAEAEWAIDWRASHRHDKPMPRGLTPITTLWDNAPATRQAEQQQGGYLDGHKDGFKAGREAAARDVEALPAEGGWGTGGLWVFLRDAVRAARGGE